MEDRIRSGTRGRKRDRRTVVAASLVIVASLLAAPVGARSKSDEVITIERAIEAGNHTYVTALEMHDAHAFSNLFVDDAVSLPPFGPLIRGRSAIEASMVSAFVRVRFVDGTMHTVETRIMGDTTVEVGTYHLVVRIDGYPKLLDGRYLTVWRRTGDTWKIAVDSSQPDDAAASSPEPRQAKE